MCAKNLAHIFFHACPYLLVTHNVGIDTAIYSHIATSNFQKQTNDIHSTGYKS